MAISDSILDAALHGPEVKEVSINELNSSKSHEFNVKPVSYRVYQNEVTVFGQISHHLSARLDDQIWFAFKKKGNKITPDSPDQMVVEKQEGGFVKTIVILKPIGVVIGAYFGFDAGKYFDKLEEHADKFQFVDMDGGWEKAVIHFLGELAKHVTIPKPISVSGLKLYQHDNLKGESLAVPVGKNIVQAKDMGWNDKASSLVANVPEGKKLELYQHDTYRGLELELGPGMHIIRDLKIHKLGDEITSVRWVNA